MSEQRFEKYKNYSSEDFMSDKYFIEWVKSESQLFDNTFWQVFIEKYPDKYKEMEIAKASINDELNQQFSAEEVEVLWDRINLSISRI